MNYSNFVYPLILLLLISCSKDYSNCDENEWEGNYYGFIDCNFSGPQGDSIIARQDISFIIFSRETDKIVFDDITLDINPILCEVGYSDIETSISGSALRSVKLIKDDQNLIYENIFDARKRQLTPFLFSCQGELTKR